MKTLIDQVDEGRDKFEGNLDNQLKNSTFRSPNGETNVSAALQDYQDNTRKPQDRFKDDYAASAEVATVLKQATAIDRYRSSYLRQAENPRAPGRLIQIQSGALQLVAVPIVGRAAEHVL